MLTLVELASEPLAQIISHLDFAAIYALWSCGDSKLNFRLAKGNLVREVAVDLKNDWNPYWFHVITRFPHIEAFSLSNRRDIDYEGIESAYLLDLPPNLKKLDLEFDSAFSTLNQLLSVTPPLFPNLNSLKLLWGDEMGESNFIFPRSLTVLDFGDEYQYLTFLEPSCLPPALISLKLNLHALKRSETASSKFPETLQTLEMLVDEHVPFFDLLPLNCEYLSYYTYDGSMVLVREEEWVQLSFVRLKTLKFSGASDSALEAAQWYPRTLETLCIYDSNSHDEEWCIEFLGKLPRTLTNLNCLWESPISIELAKAFPRTLVIPDWEEITPEALPYMPEKTKMVIPSKFSNPKVILGFPALMESIVLPKLTDSIISMFPNSLTSLGIQHQDVKLEKDIISLLPRYLVSFNVQCAKGIDIDSAESFKLLPPKMKHLSLSRQGFVADAIRSFEMPSEASLWLPRQLSSLQLQFMHFQNASSDLKKWCLGLPKYLTFLSIGISLSTAQAGISGSLFHLNHLENLEFSLNPMPRKGGEWAPLLQGLPPNLKVLRIQATKKGVESNFINDNFQNVPKSITSFQCPSSPHLSEECLQYMPSIMSWTEDGSFQRPKWFKPANNTSKKNKKKALAGVTNA